MTLSLRRLDQSGDSVVLEYAVSDQGIGIPAEQQQQIFQSFYQVDGSKTRANGGTGLGLTIAQKICRQLGGNITVESALGQGSRFSFQLKYKTFAKDSEGSIAGINEVISAAKTEHDVAQVMGAISEIDQILQRLDGPLARMQPKLCQDIGDELKTKQWPDNVSADIEKLTNMIFNYRFSEAREVVVRLKKVIL